MAKANWINYLSVLACYAIGLGLGFYNIVLTWIYLKQGSASGVVVVVTLIVSIMILLIEQMIFNWVFEPDKAINLAMPKRMLVPPDNPMPGDKIATFYFRLQLTAYHLAKLLLPVFLLVFAIAVYYADYISTLGALDVQSQLARHLVTFACVFGTEIMFRLGQSYWEWAKFEGEPSFRGASFQLIRSQAIGEISNDFLFE